MHPAFSVVHKVQFSETDLAGIVHFSNYFRWMEEVEHAFFRALGLSILMDHGAHTGGAKGRLTWPRIAVQCEYKGSARFEEDITLTLRITKLGTKSLTYVVEFTRGVEKLATGQITSVCCIMRAEGFTSIAIPDDLRAKLLGRRGDAATEP